MHNHSLHLWQHQHSFGQDVVKSGERRTLIVILITVTMMIVEIGSGIVYGSMALLADGLHMGSHSAALGISAFAYRYARKHAHNKSFTFGTGKVNALAGFSSAIMLIFFALAMAWESTIRFFNPIEIIFNQAIIVAFIGLIVNAVSVFILGEWKHEEEPHHNHHHDHNLRSAYLHVLADALTSVLAIAALIAGKYLGFNWMDPLMGIVGAVLVSRWSFGLIRDTSRILLDKEVSDEIQTAVRNAIEEKDDNRISDLHLWSIGTGIYSAAISVVTENPKPPEYYKELLPKVGIVHITLEVHKCKH